MPNVLSLYQEDVPTDSISTTSGGNYSTGGSGVSTNTNSTGNTSTTSASSTTTTGTSVIVEPEIIDTKPPKTTDTTIQGGLYPECLKKWEQVLSVTKFESTQAMEEAKKRFMTECMSIPTKGTSNVVEPEIVTPTSGTSAGSTTTNVILPNLGGFLSSLTGGGAGGGGGATEEEVLTIKKKPFPYWIIAVAVVGGYLIFRKK